MKFFVAFAALVAVAVASPLKPATTVSAELEAIVAAINSPSTDPATAALLEQQLQEIIAAANPIQVGPAIVEEPEYEPISVGPAIVEETQYEPISVGPAIVDFPLPDGGVASAPVAPSPVVVGPSPVVVGPTAPGAPAPLVQIILNIQNADSADIPPVSVITPEPIIKPQPVIVVDSAAEEAIPAEPIQVIEVAPVPAEPVQVVEPVFPAEPVQVIEAVPVPVEPVIIGTPIIPSPAVVLPETLN